MFEGKLCSKFGEVWSNIEVTILSRGVRQMDGHMGAG